MPTFTNGKICYIEIPATDVGPSADFYKRVFGWSFRKRGDGSTAFDDTVGAVSGTWVLGRPPSASPAFCFTSWLIRVAARRGRSCDHCQVPRPRRKRHWSMPTKWLMERSLGSRCCGQRRGNAEGSIDHFDEISFFASDEPFCLCCRDILEVFRIYLETFSVRLVRS